MAIARVTLTTAVDATATRLTLSSTTGMSAAQATQTCLSIDNELMLVTSVVSSTVVDVIRAQFSTKPTKHGALSSVAWGLTPNFTQTGGYYQSEPGNSQNLNGLPMPVVTPATVATATAYTLSPGEILGGLILQDPTGGAVTTTLPTAALMLAAVPGAMINQGFYFDIVNTADANETITTAAGTGGTGAGTLTIAQNNGKRFVLYFTNVLPGSEAYTYRSLGTYTS